MGKFMFQTTNQKKFDRLDPFGGSLLSDQLLKTCCPGVLSLAAATQAAASHCGAAC